MAELIFKDEVYYVIGAAMEVYYQLGRGFLEPIYQEALALELKHRDIPFETQKEVVVHYKQWALDKKYIPDFICYGQIIVELKALERLSSREEAQLLNYMKATTLPVGVLINFGSLQKLEWKRYVF